MLNVIYNVYTGLAFYTLTFSQVSRHLAINSVKLSHSLDGQERGETSRWGEGNRLELEQHLV